MRTQTISYRDLICRGELCSSADNNNIDCNPRTTAYEPMVHCRPYRVYQLIFIKMEDDTMTGTIVLILLQYPQCW